MEAAVGWSIERAEGFIFITDCTRKVSLDLSVETKSKYENSLHKVDTLLEQLTRCRKALIAESKRQGWTVL